MQRHEQGKGLDGLVGQSCEVEVKINDISAHALIDTGSTVSTMSLKFYKEHLEHVPLQDISEHFNLKCANGSDLPFMGYVEVELESPGLPCSTSQRSLFLIVGYTDYQDRVPILIGTNILKTLKDNVMTEHGIRYLQNAALHTPWYLSFRCMNQMEKELARRKFTLATVRCAESTPVRIPPNSEVTINGFFDKCIPYHPTCALIQPTYRSAIPDDLDITPTVVTYNYGSDDIVPVHISNITTRTVNIHPRALLGELHPVSVEETSFTTTEDTYDLLQEVDIEKDNLTSSEYQVVQQELRQHTDIFSSSDIDVGLTTSVFHRIELENEFPFKQKTRRIPPGMYDEVRNHLQQLLSSGIIRKSKSPWSSNVVLCRKKDGKLRMCVDYRQLNLRTIRDSYALPKIDEILEALQGNRFFTVLDMKSGYHQISVQEEHKQRTAFTVGPLGFYEYNRMPFGLVNAPATYQRLMEDCFDGLNLQICFIYLDDLIIFSKTFEEHIDRLRQVFDRIRQEGLKLSPQKCHFFKTKVKYVGHIVSQDGIQPDPAKIEKVMEWPRPKTPEDVRQFLGFIGYYRKFIQDFSKISRPLNDLMPSTHKQKKKGKTSQTEWKWTDRQEESFQYLKSAIAKPPVLGYPNFDKPFELHTDASAAGLGAILYQQQDGEKRVISYASRSLNRSEKNYPAHKLEFLALKWAVTEKYKDYLTGHNFVVYTDNNPLTYILTTAKLDATSQRWIAALSSYSFSLKSRSGKHNADADALSRLPALLQRDQDDLTKETIEAICNAVDITPYIDSIAMNPDSADVIQSSDIVESRTIDWKERQDMDRMLNRWKHYVRIGKKPKVEDMSPEHQPLSFVRNFKYFILENNIMYRKTVIEGEEYKQLVIPRSYINTVLQQLHDKFGHPGRERTSSLVRDRFYWSGMTKDIDNWVKNCRRCIHRKTPTTQRAPLTNIRTSYPLELVCMDYLQLEKSGSYQYILVITDHFTRLAQAIPTRNMTAKTTAKALFDNFITYYGIPYRLHSDQGGSFEAKIIKELCAIADISKSRTTPYHPMSNGMCERYNKSLLDMLGTLQPEQKSRWKDYVRPLVHAYNCTRHESTGHSPYHLMFGREPHLPIDLMFGIDRGERQTTTKYIEDLKAKMKKAYDLANTAADKARDKQKKGYDVKARDVTLQEGDKVLVKIVAFDGRHKIADRWKEEPYVIVRQTNPNIPVFEVKKINGHGKKRTLHRNLLLPIGHLHTYEETTANQKKSGPSNTKQVVEKHPTEELQQMDHVTLDPQSDSDSDTDTVIMQVPVPNSTEDIHTDVESSVDTDPEDIADDQQESDVGSIHSEETTGTESSQVPESDENTDSSEMSQPSSDSSPQRPVPRPRQSVRVKKPPAWMKDYVVNSIGQQETPSWQQKVDYLQNLLDTGQGQGHESEIICTILSIMRSCI